MTITNFKPDEYKNCPIYFRHWHTHFEYLTIVKNEIYTAHVTIYPGMLRRLSHFLGILPSAYSGGQLGAIVASLKRMAETTIDTILEPKKY